MPIQFPNGFTITSGEPVDTKLVLTKAQMKTAHTEFSMPSHYFCLCSEDNKLYVYDSTNTIDETIGRFRLATTEASAKSYTDLSSETAVSLNEKLDTGVYNISHATDRPDGTSESGLLSVTKLDDTHSEQAWYSDTNFSYRVATVETPVPPTTAFYVNGVETTPDENGNVYLSQAGATWNADSPVTLSGTLTGQVIIPDVTGTTDKKYITLILNGVTITSATEHAIYGAYAEGNMSVEIKEGTTNTLTVTGVGTTDDSFAALYCDSDLFLSGTGTLNIITTSTHQHGIKAKDLLISGMPTINITAGHDGIHSKTMQIGGGKITINDANDAFAAGTKSNSGIIAIGGGDITINKCNQNAFQVKAYTETGGEGTPTIKIFNDTKLTLAANYSTDAFSDVDGGTIEVYPTVTIVNPGEKAIQGLKTVETAWATTPSVYDNDNRCAITAVNNVFDITSSGASFLLTGNFTGYRVIVENASKTLQLNGIYCDTQTDDENAFIDYVYDPVEESSKKNVKLVLIDNKVNYIKKKKGYVVKSTHNVNINVGASLGTDIFTVYMSCPEGYAMNCVNEARIQNDGFRYFVNSKYGIKANLVNCGDELKEEGTVESGEDGYNKKKTSLIYVNGNTDYDIGLYHRTYPTSGTPTVDADGQINVTANCYGTAYLGKIKKIVDTETIGVLAEEHVVNPGGNSQRTVGPVFTRYPFAYAYNTSDTFTNPGNRVVSIAPPTTEVLATAVSDTTTVTGTWKIYSSLSNYTSLEARVAALEGGSINPSISDTGVVTLNNTTISTEGVVNFGNKATLSSEGVVSFS